MYKCIWAGAFDPRWVEGQRSTPRRWASLQDSDHLGWTVASAVSMVVSSFLHSFLQFDLIRFDSIRFDFSKLKLMTSQPRRRERSSHRKESFRERCILCFRLGFFFFFFFFFCFSKKFLEMISNSEKIKVWEFKSPPRKSVGARIPDFTEVLRGFFFCWGIFRRNKPRRWRPWGGKRWQLMPPKIGNKKPRKSELKSLVQKFWIESKQYLKFPKTGI